ncbi:MAG: hypothetical protein OXU86_02875 [Thaumarchaeota archaeon]|nr:hypothetical protein [Nitrososphaerota archaeon]RNJ72294.1 MAG: hypothetical protein EB832_04105 [Thaumarchaeota archaeon S14]RNJ73579.1 MAG: hypothetical protein EB833_02475 [Thaumarchaeota archaeon S13]RNJ75393.1 MAG: hypothetical protein EB824_01760 [Thaumarchaeota archaeon S15]MDD9812903.1 hypothetical protein [Nitrososphaerota archaeon]
MALEGPGELPLASVRIDRSQGRVFLTPASSNGSCDEVVIDVLPSQLPDIVAEFGNGGRPMKDPPAMSPAELEELKDRIMRAIKAKEQFYPGEIAIRLGLEYKTVMEALNSLEGEGKIKVHDDE